MIFLALLVLSIILAMFFVLIKLFFSHVIFFEAILLLIISIFFGINKLELHPVYSILISAVIFITIFTFWNTKIGFWLLSIPFSVGWAYLAGIIVHEITKGDMIWTVFVGMLSLVVIFTLHIKARPNSQDNLQAEIAVSKDNPPQE